MLKMLFILFLYRSPLFSCVEAQKYSAPDLLVSFFIKWNGWQNCRNEPKKVLSDKELSDKTQYNSPAPNVQVFFEKYSS